MKWYASMLALTALVVAPSSVLAQGPPPQPSQGEPKQEPTKAQPAPDTEPDPKSKIVWFDVEAGVCAHVRARLGHHPVVDAYPPREHERLRAAPALDQAAFGEQDVEANHGWIVAGFSLTRWGSGQMRHQTAPT